MLAVDDVRLAENVQVAPPTRAPLLLNVTTPDEMLTDPPGQVVLPPLPDTPAGSVIASLILVWGPPVGAVRVQLAVEL